MRTVNGSDFGVYLGVDALGGGEKSLVADNTGGSGQQHVPFVEGSADIIRIAAGGHGQLGGFLQQRDFRAFIQTLGAGGRLGTGGRTADYDNFLGAHLFSPLQFYTS